MSEQQAPIPEPNQVEKRGPGRPKKTNEIKDWLQSDLFHNALAAVLPRHLTTERFIRVAISACMRTPDLFRCTKESLLRCLLDLSSMGLEPDGRMAHLIPFRNNKQDTFECTLIVDWKGKVQLMLRSPEVASVYADIICENDDFEFDMGEIRRHKIDFRKPRGPLYASYCRVVLKTGAVICTVLSKEEIDASRKRSRAADKGPWVTDYKEMAKKPSVHRMFKFAPSCSEIRDVLDKIESHEFVDSKEQKTIAAVDLGTLLEFSQSADENRGHDDTGFAKQTLDEPLGGERVKPPTITKEQADDLYRCGLDAEGVKDVLARYGYSDADHVPVNAYASLVQAIVREAAKPKA